MKRVVVTQPMIGICYMQVCAVTDASDEEILEVARENNEDENLRPVDCDDNVSSRKHFIVIC